MNTLNTSPAPVAQVAASPLQGLLGPCVRGALFVLLITGVAYPLATQLTAKLGLKGFTLNLAVESAQGFDGLVELLPRLRSALGDEGVRPLQAVLQGR